MRNLFSILLCAAIPFAAQAQVKTAQAMVYFQSDKFDIEHAEIKNLDSVYFSLNANEIDSIHLNANTDSKGSNAYNKKLSEKRAQSIIDYLYKNIVEAEIYNEVYLRDKPIRYKAYGEEHPLDDNDAEKGRKRNRRVEVVFYYHTTKRIVVLEPDSSSKEKFNGLAISCWTRPPLYADTIIMYPGAIEVTMTTEQGRSNCIQVNPLRTQADLRSSGIITETTNGDILQSGGGFEVKSCDNKPFDKPIEIRMSLNPCFGEGRDIYVYEHDAWGLQKNKRGVLKAKRSDFRGTKMPAMMKYTVYRPMIVNCDKLISESNKAMRAKKERLEKRRASIREKSRISADALVEKLKDPVYRVDYYRSDYSSFKTIVPQDLKVDSIFFTNECPFYRISTTAIKRQSPNETEWAVRKISLPLLYIELYVSNKEGEQFILKRNDLNSIDTRSYASPHRKLNINRSLASEERKTKNSFRKILVFQMEDFKLKPNTVSKVTSR